MKYLYTTEYIVCSMNNKKIGKILVATGVAIAIVPLVAISILAYLTYGRAISGIGNIGTVFFMIGLGIIIIGEVIKKR